MFRTSCRCALGAGMLFACITPLSAAPTQPTTPSDWASPNLFQSVALPVPTTLYDSQWRRAWAGGRGPVATRATNGAEPTALAQLAIVHRDVNQRVSYRADLPGLSVGDSWSTAGATLARGSGDCEDFAIAKAQGLLALGFRPQDLYLVIGNDRNQKARHAILVVRAQSKFWVLDNLSNKVIDADLFRHFDPIITLSADRKWVHGYRKGARERVAALARNRPRDASSVKLAAVMLAQAQVAPTLPIAF